MFCLPRTIFFALVSEFNLYSLHFHDKHIPPMAISPPLLSLSKRQEVHFSIKKKKKKKKKKSSRALSSIFFFLFILLFYFIFFFFGLPTDIGGYTSRALQKVSLPVLSPDTCNFLFGRPLASGEFCAGYRQGGKDACQVSDWQHRIAALNRRRLPLLSGSN